MSDHAKSQSQDFAYFQNLIKDIRFGMLVTRDSGQLQSAPLTTLDSSEWNDDAVYFFVPKDGGVARAIAADAQVNISYADPDEDRYVSVSGRAALDEDMAKKEKLFNTFTKAWFPKGPTDPNLGLLRVAVEAAESWDVKESQVTQLFKMVKAAVTGERPDGMGEHAVLRS